MCMFIGIESLAANALIEVEKTGKRDVCFETLVKYGSKVAKFLHEQTGEEAILLLSKKYQQSMIENYSNYFEVKLDKLGQRIFWLKDGVTIDELSDYFRWAMSMKVIKAFMSPEAIMELGITV